MKRFSVRNVLIAGFALSAVVVYMKTTMHFLGHTYFDDAYMITRYAKHWLMGEGFSWNIVDGPAYGITSPVYLIIVTAVLGLTRCSDAMALTITSLTAGLLSVFALVLLGFLAQGDRRLRASYLPLLVVPSLLLLPPFRFHSLTGMETTLSLFMNSILATSIVMAVRRRTTAALLACVFSGFASYATRPDNGLYAILLPPLFFVATDWRLWRYAARYAAFLAVLVLCSLILSRMVFADSLPLPFFAKAAGFYEGYVGAPKWNAVRETLRFCTAAAPFLLVIVATISKKTLAQVLVIAFVVGGTFTYYATVTQIMGWNARYYYPSLAFVVLAAFTTYFSQPEERLVSTVRGGAGLRLLLGLAVLLVVLSSRIKDGAADLWEKHVIGKPSAVPCLTVYKTPAGDPLPELGWWPSILAMTDLLERVPEGTVLAASEYGFIGSRFAELTIVDLVGLHDRTLAHHGFDLDYVLSREPDLIWLPHADYTGAVARILDHPRFHRDYEYYPGAYDYGIALRRSSERYMRMKDVVSREFTRVYIGLNLSDYMAEQVAAPDKQ